MIKIRRINNLLITFGVLSTPVFSYSVEVKELCTENYYEGCLNDQVPDTIVEIYHPDDEREDYQVYINGNRQ